MESCGQLDATGGPATGRSLSGAPAVLLALLLSPLFALAQSDLAQSDLDPLRPIKQSAAEERWLAVVQLVESSPVRSAEVDYYYGMALAQLGRWNEARSALKAGSRAQPNDKRFPIELAGIAFKHKDYAAAKAELRRALHIDPADSYANDFLASIYFLQENVEAALKYWNRVSKPRIQEIRADPAPRLDPVLLDRAFAFSPASTLRLQDLLTSEARISALQIFLNHRFDLAAHDDGTFDVVFRAQERNGWGNNTLQALIGVFRELPYKAITPECFNLRNQSINFASLVRWDAQKRRALASLSGPLHRDAKWRYRLEVDLRNENWDVRGSFSGLAPLLAGLNLRREAASAGIVSLSTARWNWSTGVEFSHRDFRNLIPGVVLTPGLLSSGFQLKHLARLHHELWRIPQRRFRLDSSVSSQLGRIWSQPTHSFGKLQGSLSAHWFPLSQGDDYEVLAQARSGKTMGTVPFDELFMLGVERDNDLWLRAHIGTRDGRKGSAPLGRDYFLTNWEVDKNVYQNGLISFKLGPFVDSGKVTDSSSTLGSKNWLWDTGVQLKVRVLGIGVGISYGKDLRTGNNAIYTTVAR